MYDGHFVESVNKQIVLLEDDPDCFGRVLIVLDVS